jgi:hypothetical protein
LLYARISYEEDPGCLAGLTSPHYGRFRWRGPGYNHLTSALEHSNRIRQIKHIYTYLTASQLEEIWGAMQVPFPELTLLVLAHHVPNETAPVLPGSFLGGSAPRLQFLTVIGFPFLGFQK